MIALKGVSKVYPATRTSASVTALDAVDLTIGTGEIFGVIGRSGAGKSTLIRTINGLETPTGGSVVVDGVEITRLAARPLREARRGIGMIFQHFNLLSSRTAYQNVALPLELAGLSAAEIRARVEPMLDLVGLADKRDRFPVELSGGQKQRVGIARALATRPKVLLSDEATSALDPETTRSILALLKQVNRDLGVTIVLITHEMAVVREICDRVGVIEAGRIIEQGKVFDVATRPRTETARSFLAELNGAALSPSLVARLRQDPCGTCRTVFRLTFSGPLADDPIITRLARHLDTDVAILSARVEEIAGRPFGTMIVTIDNAHGASGAAEGFLRSAGIETEKLGHVA
ncbi:hypothetical protein ABB55_22590 [Prosthecomicrobium hirschii]|uniref:Cell division ATP-binding protein FtsE n=1 Tax=Prosthecodimorpha hirschii TaxID=665126 RepID=A0A0P6VPB9_9HYPH|nr:methionine ABC transporter ATP-binding protein [Prosthecomicrobium hirschii]KPL54668.1 hypothetical protein ABB55_22590 [Prosthecomicrobium hirschii]